MKGAAPHNMAKYLSRYYGKKVIILPDEYGYSEKQGIKDW